MLPMKVAQGVRAGTVSLAFRRWQRQDVKVGSQFVTSAGVVRVVDVRLVDPAAISDEEAVLAGHPNADKLRARLRDDPTQQTWRVELAWVGEDPRIALRERGELTDEDYAAIVVRLDRLDRASSHGPWTTQTLELIREHSRRRAPDLAELVGRERDPFKLDVRKLKNLGLTQSFEVGYALSPRGRAYLQRRTSS